MEGPREAKRSRVLKALSGSEGQAAPSRDGKVPETSGRRPPPSLAQRPVNTSSKPFPHTQPSHTSPQHPEPGIPRPTGSREWDSRQEEGESKGPGHSHQEAGVDPTRARGLVGHSGSKTTSQGTLKGYSDECFSCFEAEDKILFIV